MELHVHLHQRLLHPLHIRCCLVNEALTVPYVSPEPHQIFSRPEASAK